MSVPWIDADLKLKLAKAARELANELEAGTGPVLGFGQQFHPTGEPCCAMGYVYTKAGLKPTKLAGVDIPAVGPDQIPFTAITVAYEVENINDSHAPGHRPSETSIPDALRNYAFAVEGL